MSGKLESPEETEVWPQRERKVRKQNCHGTQKNGIFIKEGKVGNQYCREVKQGKHRNVSIEADKLMVIGSGDLSQSQVGAGKERLQREQIEPERADDSLWSLAMKWRKETTGKCEVRVLLFIKMKMKRLVI